MNPTDKAFPVIAACDPAIDTAAMLDTEMLAYITARDVSKLPIKIGQQPTRFVLRPITQREMLGYVMHGATLEEKHARAFCSSVDSVQGAWIDGRQCSWSPADKRSPMTADECALFSLAEILDVGGVAWVRSFLGQRIAPRFALAQSLREHMVDLPYRYAEQSDAVTNSNEASETRGSSDHAGPVADATSASPTVAHATAENIQPGA
jgi:hypothetical protein